jgi:hypothetical protein
MTLICLLLALFAALTFAGTAAFAQTPAPDTATTPTAAPAASKTRAGVKELQEAQKVAEMQGTVGK